MTFKPPVGDPFWGLDVEQGRLFLPVMRSESPEGAAKAGLLNHLRSLGQLRKSAIISELVVDGWAHRADLVVAGPLLTCFEIKSYADRLDRLDAQISAFSKVFDKVVAVLATRHVNAALSRLPSHVGILELVDFGRGVEARLVREGAISPDVDLSATLRMFPATEIATMLRRAGVNLAGMRGREALQLAARQVPLSEVRQGLRDYLRKRFAERTAAFTARTRRRKVIADDVAQLSMWAQARASVREPQAITFDEWVAGLAREQAFGSVPDDIRALLSQSFQGSSVSVTPPGE